MSTKVPYTSQHANYLIWRYLQERGYGAAAIQLQRDWGNGDPESLSFAKEVRPGELVKLIRDGLHLDDLGVQYGSEDDRKYKFIVQPEPITQVEDSTGGGDHRDPTTSGSSSSRPANHRHKSNERGRGATSRHHAVESIEVEMAQPPIVEEPPPVTTADIGEERGIQTMTIYEPTVLKSFSANEVAGDVFSLNWHDPPNEGEGERLLATGGHIWRTFRMPLIANTAADDVPALDSADFGRCVVSSLAIDPTGKKAAIALDKPYGTAMLILVELADEEQTQERIALTKAPSSILLLRWSPSAKMLLYATAHAGECPASFNRPPEMASSPYGAWAVMNIDDRISIDMRMRHGIPIDDATWVDESKIICVGPRVLDLFKISPTGAEVDVLGSIDTHESWEMVKYDAITNQACCVCNSGIILLDLSGDGFSTRCKVMDYYGITGAEWQPSKATPVVPSEPAREEGAMEIDSETPAAIKQEEPKPSPRIFATCTQPGSLTLWNAAGDLQRLRDLTMPDGADALALAFSPDGKYIAVCGADIVSIWTVEEDVEEANVLEKKGKPFAVWKADTESEQAHENGDAAPAMEADEAAPVVQNTDTIPATENGDAVHAVENGEVVPAATNGNDATAVETADAVAAVEAGTTVPAVENGATDHVAENVSTALAPEDGAALPAEEEEPWNQHLLSWNASSTKLAFSTGNKITVIDFPNAPDGPWPLDAAPEDVQLAPAETQIAAKPTLLAPEAETPQVEEEP